MNYNINQMTLENSTQYEPEKTIWFGRLMI